MARVKGIIAAGLSSARTGLPSSLDAAAPVKMATPVETDHVPLLEQIRARSARIQDAQSTAPNAELAAQSGLAGLGAAAVFGPAGLLVGGLVHLLGRRRLKNMRELANQDAEATTASIERARSSLNAAREAAETDAERAEVDLHIDRFEQLEALTLHPDGNVRSNALIAMLDVTGQLDTELEEVEARRLEAEARERDRFEYEVGRADDIRGELMSEVGGDFLERLDAYRSMLAVEDSSMGDQTLIIRAMKINDPTSAVLPGEAATAQNAAGVPQILITTWNHLVRSGERLTEQQRADIIRQAGLIVSANQDSVIDANTSAAERMRDQGVREELVASSLIPLPNPDKLPLPRNSERLGSADRAALEGPAPELEEEDPVPLTDDDRARRVGQSGGEAMGRGGEALRAAAKGVIEGALGIQIENGRVYEPGSIGAARARLESELAATDDPERRELLLMDMRVLDAAEGEANRGPRRGNIIRRPSNAD